MMRGFIALLMVVLIGNPVCCCAFSGEKVSTEEEVHSCCKALDDPAAPSDDDGSPANCPCSKKAGVVAPDKMAVPAPSLSLRVPPMLAHDNFLSGIVNPSRSVKVLRCPPRFSAATGPPLHLRYSVLLC